jgi:transposase-like protein
LGNALCARTPQAHSSGTSPANRSWRVDETYIRVAGAWTYLYRSVDSTGATIDFMLSPKRDLVAAKDFLQIALWRTGQIRPP